MKNLPRVSELSRPSVACEQVLLVFALKDPEPDLLLLDRLLLVSREKDLPAAVIFNKIDVVAEATAKKYFQAYQKAGYETILCSAKLGVGLEEVRQILKNKILYLPDLPGPENPAF